MTDKLKWTTVTKRIEQLVPYGKNPRRLTDKQYNDLKASLTKFSLAEIPVIDADGVIIAGHMRLKVLAEIESPQFEVDVRVPNRKLTEKEFQEYNIRSNKNTGEFDFDILANEFEIEDLIDWGFEEDELLGGDDGNEETGTEDDTPAKPEIPRSQLGDIYELGNHRVLCGDSTDKEIVAVLMDGNKANMVFTDPPYVVDYSNAERPNPSRVDLGKIKNDNIDLSDFLPKIFDNLFLYTTEDCAFYVWHADKTANIFYNCIELSGIEFDQMLIWKKPMLLGRGKYQYAHEPCIFAKKGKPFHTTDRTKTTVWDFGGYDKSSNVHPTQKPVFLPEEGLQNSSRKGDLILDLFLGSGSTLIACEKTKRACYGIELDDNYVDVIIERWCQYTGKRNIIRNGEPYEWKEQPSISE